MSDLDDAQILEEPEWLVCCGTGGFASGTRSGCATRNYHGLLVAAYPRPFGRRLLLSHVEEWGGDVINSDSTRPRRGADAGSPGAFSLASNLYGQGVIYPRGFEHLESFRAEPEPLWIWRIAGRRIARRLSLERRANGGELEWELLDGAPCHFEVSLFTSGRSFHGGPASDSRNWQGDAVCANWVHDPALPALELTVCGAEFFEQEKAHRDFYRAEEDRRGYSCREDLESRRGIRGVLSADNPKIRLCFGDRDRRPSTVVHAAVPSSAPERLRAATLLPSFESPGSGRRGLLAGYPWFGEWGRDTMISLPGFARASGDVGLVFEILQAWVDRMSEGMLPNRIRERGDAQNAASKGADDQHLWNSADASLFFLRALSNLSGWRKMRPGVLRDRFHAAVEQVLICYHRGTRHDIAVDPDDGLLHAGSLRTQLTWMDAQSFGQPVTPRFGKCVELNALYLLGLRLWKQWSQERGDSASSQLAQTRLVKLENNFEARFWRPELGYLLDTVDGDGDLALRPNLLFALAEKGGFLSAPSRRGSLKAVDERLLTPFGLRTLDPRDPRYCGQYRGDQEHRDAAYHQGCVWPWLWGVYVDAVLAVRGRGQALGLYHQLQSALADLNRGTQGQIGELAEGDPPYRTCGAGAQAWSAAEMLRAWRKLATILNSSTDRPSIASSLGASCGSW
ncbi:MAG: amylo-alpha-1,6-glucosidase [Planctomycetota bacterium]